MLWLFLLIFVVAGFFILKTKRKKYKKKSRLNAAAQSKNESAKKYRAISICCENHACAEAIASQKKRFLLKETPQLPLAGCNADKCRCRYEHHDDRRSEEDRRLPFGLSNELHRVNDGERRETRDRRKTM